MENIFKAYKIKTNLLAYGNLFYRKDMPEQKYQLPTCFLLLVEVETDERGKK